MPNVLIFDIGTGGVHVNLIDQSGHFVGSAYEEIRYAYLKDADGLEWNAAASWDKSLLAAEKVLGESGVARDSIVAVAVTSQRHGQVFMGEGDREIMATPNMDNRSTEQARRVAERGAEIYDHTARWPDIFFPAVRLLWLKDNRPADFAQVTRILMVNEYFIYRLTGRMCSEWTNAAETLLFDTGRLAWSDWLPGFFDMGRIKPNDLIAPGDIADNLRPDLASRLGLGHIPVVAAVSDTQAATLGSGMIRPGDVVAVNGSTTPVLMVEDHFLLDPERRIWVDPYIRNLWLLESNCLSSGMVHRKLMDHLTELIRLLPGQEGFGRPELYALLDKLEDRTEGVIASFGPRRFHVSRRCGQERCEVSFPNEQTNIFAAILPAYVENLAFAIVSNVEQLEVISGRRVERFCLTGGGSRSRHLRRLIPLLLPGRQIKVTRDLETTSRGAAMQALATVGVYADVQSAIAGMTGEDWYEEVSQEQDVPGLAERHRAWRERYD